MILIILWHQEPWQISQLPFCPIFGVWKVLTNSKYWKIPQFKTKFQCFFCLTITLISANIFAHCCAPLISLLLLMVPLLWVVLSSPYVCFMISSKVPWQWWCALVHSFLTLLFSEKHIESIPSNNHWRQDQQWNNLVDGWKGDSQNTYGVYPRYAGIVVCRDSP